MQNRQDLFPESPREQSISRYLQLFCSLNMSYTGPSIPECILGIMSGLLQQVISEIRFEADFCEKDLG